MQAHETSSSAPIQIGRVAKILRKDCICHLIQNEALGIDRAQD